jgi:hypothetical protein
VSSNIGCSIPAIKCIQSKLMLIMSPHGDSILVCCMKALICSIDCSTYRFLKPRLDSPLRYIIQINRKWVQLIAGIERPIFEDTKTIYHMEGKWFVSIREFLHATDCQLKSTTGWVPQLERKYSQCLMDRLIAPTPDIGKK